jgi:hypothetical protein
MSEPGTRPPPSGPESRPPLWTWGAALALALSVVGGLILSHDALQPRVMAYQLNLDRLARRSDHLLVVVLGGSKSQCSIDFDGVMSARLRRLGVEADFVRVTYAQADFDDLSSAFDRLKARPPAMVLVESELILLQPHAYRPPDYQKESWIGDLRSDLGSLSGLRVRQDDVRYGGPACGEAVLTPHRRPLPVYRAMLARDRVSTPAERRPWLDRLAALRAHGTQVAMIELQHAPAADIAFPEQLERDTRQLRLTLTAQDGLADLEPAWPRRAENFIDLGHRNRRGREVYSAWLAGEIARMLREAPSTTRKPAA